MSMERLENTLTYLEASERERTYLRQIEDDHFYAVCAVVILNEDESALEKITRWEARYAGMPSSEEELEEWQAEQPHAPRRRKAGRKNPGAIPAPTDPLDLQYYNQVDEIDDFAIWFFNSAATEILELRPTFRRLIDSWIAADYRTEQWSEWPRFERFLRTRGRYSHFYQDWFDNRDGRFLQGYHLRSNASPDYLAYWLFMELTWGPDCRNIGRCASCGRYCIRNRRRTFFCDERCSRYQHSKQTKRQMRLEARNEKLQDVIRAAKELNRRSPMLEREWKHLLIEKVKNRGIAAKFVTQVIRAGEVPIPKFLR